MQQSGWRIVEAQSSKSQNPSLPVSLAKPPAPSGVLRSNPCPSCFANLPCPAPSRALYVLPRAKTQRPSAPVSINRGSSQIEVALAARPKPLATPPACGRHAGLQNGSPPGEHRFERLRGFPTTAGGKSPFLPRRITSRVFEYANRRVFRFLTRHRFRSRIVPGTTRKHANVPATALQRERGPTRDRSTLRHSSRLRRLKHLADGQAPVHQSRQPQSLPG